jgi:hypothetical protein
MDNLRHFEKPFMQPLSSPNWKNQKNRIMARDPLESVKPGFNHLPFVIIHPPKGELCCKMTMNTGQPPDD